MAVGRKDPYNVRYQIGSVVYANFYLAESEYEACRLCEDSNPGCRVLSAKKV